MNFILSLRVLRHAVRGTLLAAMAALVPAAVFAAPSLSVTFDDVVFDFPDSSISNCFSDQPIFVAGQGMCGERLQVPQGYTFGITGSGDNYRVGQLSPNPADTMSSNGTVALFAVGPNPLTLARTDGASFSLVSFDFAEHNAGQNVPPPQAVQVLGIRSDGTSVTQRFTFDATYDGSGPLADFQRATLARRFRSLVEVRFTLLAPACPSGECYWANAIAIDNVVLRQGR